MTGRYLIFGISFLIFLLVALNVSATKITVCPSGCNYTTIQYAIDNASSGDTIEVGVGIYTEDLLINTELNIVGNDMTDTTVEHDVSSDQVVLINASNVTITGLKIDGKGITHVVNWSNEGVWNNTEISNCHIINSSQSALYPYYDSGGIRSNYTFNDNIIEYFGSSSSHASLDAFGVLDIEMKRNVIRNSNPRDSYTYGSTCIYFMDYTSGVIEGNNISCCYGAIMINSNVGDVYINNNTITKSRYGILEVESFARIHITNNTVSTWQDPTNYPLTEKGLVLGGDGDYYDSCPPYDYEVDNLSHEVSGNTFTGTYKEGLGSIGIQVVAGMIDEDYGASGNIHDNVFTNYDYGMYIYGSYGNESTHVNVVFTENSVNDCNTYVKEASSDVSFNQNVTDNWWGCTTPNISKFSGDITYYPFCLDAECSEDIEDEIDEFTGNDTTDFSQVSNWSCVDLCLDETDGMIDWTENVSLCGCYMKFDHYVEISYKRISVDTTNMPQINQPATLTFKNAGYTNTDDFSLKRDGITCPATICSNIRIQNGNVLVDVTQMSDYWLEDSVLGGMPSVTANLVVTLGFGIIGVFTLLTLLLFTAETDPKNFIRIMITATLVIVFLSGVFVAIIS